MGLAVDRAQTTGDAQERPTVGSSGLTERPELFQVISLGEAGASPQTLNGFCRAKVAVAPSVKKFGVWVAGMAALIVAWNFT